MQNVKISAKYQLSKLITLYFVFLLLLGILILPFIMESSVIYRCLSALLIAFMIFLLFVVLRRRMKMLEIKDDQILVQTYIGRQRIFPVRDLHTIHMNRLSFHHVQRINVVVFQHAVNQTEILSCLLDALDIKNAKETLHHLLHSNMVMFTKEEACSSSRNTNAKIHRVVFPIFVGSLVLFLGAIIYRIVINHWPIIWVVGLLLSVGLVAFCAFFFEKRIEAIRGKVKRAFVNILMYAACLMISVILSVGIYYLFVYFRIDLLAVRF